MGDDDDEEFEAPSSGTTVHLESEDNPGKKKKESGE